VPRVKRPVLLFAIVTVCLSVPSHIRAQRSAWVCSSSGLSRSADKWVINGLLNKTVADSKRSGVTRRRGVSGCPPKPERKYRTAPHYCKYSVIATHNPTPAWKHEYPIRVIPNNSLDDTAEMYASVIIVFAHLYTYDLDL